jgi:hypothetical protein
MHKTILGLITVSSVLMAGCSLEAGDTDGEIASIDQALVAVTFKGGGNTGFSQGSDKSVTIKADKLANASAHGSLALNIKVDNSAPFEVGSVTSADCVKRTIRVTYSQADIQQFTTTSPLAHVRNGRCIASVLLQWSRNRAPGTLTFPPPSTAASQQRVLLSAMPVTPAVGNITVVTRTDNTANNDKFDFRLDPAQ